MALKWILKCCPHLPRSLVRKPFRSRQVRRESSNAKIETHRPKRIGAKKFMGIGHRIFLPKSVDGKHPSRIEEKLSSHDEENSKVIRGLELYKGRAIIVINKPPGMPVQSGLGINRSLDVLASKYLRYDYEESTRLVVNCERTLQKRYCVLVIGSPRRREGLISTPLGKVVVEMADLRITVINNAHSLLAQHDVTDIKWLHMVRVIPPHTGRKHQLRVHCAEVLGTPIVGDYKYARQVHKKLKHFLASTLDCQWDENISKQKHVPFNLELEKGSLSNKIPPLHLHCKEMVKG